MGYNSPAERCAGVSFHWSDYKTKGRWYSHARHCRLGSLSFYVKNPSYPQYGDLERPVGEPDEWRVLVYGVVRSTEDFEFPPLTEQRFTTREAAIAECERWMRLLVPMALAMVTAEVPQTTILHLRLLPSHTQEAS